MVRRGGAALKSRATTMSLNDRFTAMKVVVPTQANAPPRVSKKSKKIMDQMEKRPAVIAALTQMKKESLRSQGKNLQLQRNIHNQQNIPRNLQQPKKQNMQHVNQPNKPTVDIKKRLTISAKNRLSTTAGVSLNKPIKNRLNLNSVLRGSGGAKGIKRLNFKVQANRGVAAAAASRVPIGQASIRGRLNNRGQRGRGGFRNANQSRGGNRNTNSRLQNSSMRNQSSRGNRGGFRTKRGGGYWLASD